MSSPNKFGACSITEVVMVSGIEHDTSSEDSEKVSVALNCQEVVP